MPESSVKNAEKNDGIQKLINKSTEIAGGAVGAALGLFVEGPAGAVLGGASGPIAATALRSIGQEVSERLLGPREEVRVGAVLAIAAAEIRQRIERGESIRMDGFFDAEQTGRSDAEEVIESVLLKSQREPEEKKIKYMGYFFSNVAFNPQISASMAHQIAKSAEQLTYRQLCILKLSVVKDNFSLRDENYRGQGSFTKELYQVLHECLDLYHRGYVNFGGKAAFGPTDIKPGSMKVQGLGADIFNLMKLSLIPDEDIAPVAAQLK